MKDKPHNTGTPELQLQMVELMGEAPRKKSANERVSIFLADINLLYTEILLIEDHLEGESDYVRGKHAVLSMIKDRLKVAIEKL
jgi:hypothetical protein